MLSQLYEALNIALNRPIAYHRIFREISGSTVAAVLLSQAWYWKDRCSEQDGWFYKTGEQWRQETGLSRKEQETARKKLRYAGFLEERKEGIPARLFYRVNVQMVCDAILAKLNEISSLPESDKLMLEVAKLGEHTDQPKLNKISSLPESDKLRDKLVGFNEISSLPESDKLVGDIRASRDDRIGQTFLYTENTHRLKEEISQKTLSADSFDSPMVDRVAAEEPTPQPPSRDVMTELARRKAQEKAQWSAERPTRSGSKFLYPWNQNNDPRFIDPDFVQWLVDRQSPFIPFNFEQRNKLDAETVTAHLRKLIHPAKRDRYEADMIESWNKYDAERRDIAARSEAMRRREESNSPENMTPYKRLSAALASHPNFEIEIANPDTLRWGLKVNIRYKNKIVLSNHPVNEMLLMNLAHHLRRLGNSGVEALRRVSFEGLVKCLGLQDWPILLKQWREAWA
jgi:hypothetical protein